MVKHICTENDFVFRTFALFALEFGYRAGYGDGPGVGAGSLPSSSSTFTFVRSTDARNIRWLVVCPLYDHILLCTIA